MKRRTKLLPRSTEHQIQTQIMNYLKYKGWYVMRLNSGKYSVGEGRSKRFIMGQEAGTPDLMAFKGGQYKYVQKYEETESYFSGNILFIEVKAGTNKPTALQTAKMKELEGYGARCIVAYGIEDLEKAGF